MSDSLIIIAEGAKKVLLYLAKNGPASGYTIFDGNTELLRASVYAHLAKLAKKGLVEWQYAAPSRGFLKKKIYSLTLRGLAYVLTQIARPKAWRPIVDRWAHLLPLVLGKWHVIVDAGNEDYMQHHLFHVLCFGNLLIHTNEPSEVIDVEALTDVMESPDYSERYFYGLVGDYMLSLSAEDLQGYFYGVIGDYLRLLEDQTHLRWLQQVCARDEEICVFVFRHLSVALSDMEKRYELVRTVKRHLGEST